MGIFTHVCLGSNDIARAEAFYDAALAPLGINNVGGFLDQGIGYGRKVAELLILRPLDGAPAVAANGGTVSFKAPTRDAVRAFHAAGLGAGGTDAGAPGPRGAVKHAFGAYLFDPDGNKICAYCFSAPD
ncbi:MAG: glyoxalase [Novosphingobium sp. 32-60-15]|uniref:VOC family protein n=1 Tax=unclassified Novosphingobium TaxID=2644732 RepID=UPI000BDCB471|nr:MULTISPECIES: VOC family protein [unclassified Novosphingobium]OYX64455.1 MAG: glyoxalase [Novosphingobium sp. 32-60-15]